VARDEENGQRQVEQRHHEGVDLHRALGAAPHEDERQAGERRQEDEPRQRVGGEQDEQGLHRQSTIHQKRKSRPAKK